MSENSVRFDVGQSGVMILPVNRLHLTSCNEELTAVNRAYLWHTQTTVLFLPADAVRK